jgi:DNA mismatch repair protein MutS
LTDEGLLDPRASNYLAALLPWSDGVGLAWVELSTGRFAAGVVQPSDLGEELARLEPAECLVPENCALGKVVPQLAALNGMAVTERPGWSFEPSQARDALLRHFGTATLEGFDLEEGCPSVAAAGAILQYLNETQKTNLGHIARLEPYRHGSTLVLDESTRRSLELVRTLREGKREGSLLAVLDETVTPMGARLLADWLAAPLTDRSQIEARQEAIGELVREPLLCRDLAELLRQTYDLERLTTRISTLRASPRDLGFLARTLGVLPKLKAKLTGRKAPLLSQLEAELDLCPEVRADVGAALVDEPPLATRDGGIIRDGYHADLDEQRELSRGGKQWIASYQAREIERTGIPSLKVGFNNVFGYYLEVTHVHAAKVPADYSRKQTLKNAERYITPELKEHEDRVLRAEERARDLEYDLFVQLRERTAAHGLRLQKTASVLATVDVLVALASIAAARNYCRPEMVDDPVLEIVDGRHAVLDVLRPQGEFVPNDAALGSDAGTILLITGPNMAGKSTYIRQVALVVLMAQMGGWVPARRARLGIADRIFARVGASDELSRGQSTFMVEMTETARILNAATPRSLVILDEIGRGTSTYDGISLAWAVVEHVHERIGCRTLFATHYHELTELARNLADVRNLNVSVKEWEDKIIFLHKIVPGPADKSYGIHVARLAGVPRGVVERAKEVLAALEEEHLDSKGRPKLRRAQRGSGQLQLPLFAPSEHPLIDEVRKLDLEHTTPLEAMRQLAAWQERLREQEQN